MASEVEFWPMTDRQRELQQIAREFALKEIRPAAKALDETSSFSEDIYQKLAKQGLLGITIPEEWGGSGADTQSYALAMEELSYGYASIADLCGLVELVATLLLELGTQEQKQRYLTPLVRADLKCSFALTESEAGSDLASLSSLAVKSPNGYLLNGSKTFIHNGPVCDFSLVLARSQEEGDKHRSMSIFIVDSDLPGFSRGKKENKLGQRASQLSSLFFKDCSLPEDALLGNDGEGFKNMMIVLEKGRIGIAALSLGIYRAALEESLKFTANRRKEEKPGGNSQTKQWTLADMATDIFAARAMIRHAAALKDRGIPATMHASMAKLFASEMAVKHTAAAVELQGIYGYSKDSIVERLYRDAKVTQIYEGTSEVQRIIIARNLQRKGLMP
jgi:alkylation response protein AidB-like acyl-CoA dehydrogenase